MRKEKKMGISLEVSVMLLRDSRLKMVTSDFSSVDDKTEFTGAAAIKTVICTLLCSHLTK